MKTFRQEWGVFLALLALWGLLAVVAPGFFQGRQMLSLATATAPVLVAALGAALVILGREIDISIGSQFALCSVAVGLAVQRGAPTAVLLVLAPACGALMGGINGALVAGARLPSIVVTLATMVTWREALRWAREGEFVRDLPERFQWFGLSQQSGQWAVVAAGLAVWLVFWFVTSHTAGGRFLHAVGSDPESARLAGIRPRWITLWSFVGCGMLTGGAALLNAVRFTDVDPKTGTGLEMQAIAAAVVGGVAISGGRGHAFGVLAGVALLATIGPALVFLKLPPQWERALQGAVILVAVAGERLLRHRRGGPETKGEVRR